MKRGSYARRACNHCRRRYVIMTLLSAGSPSTVYNAENQNVMVARQLAQRAKVPATRYAPFFGTGIDVVLIHHAQCSWGPESAKRPTSKQYVDSLRSLNKQLTQRNRFLESQLALYTSRPGNDVASSLALRISDRGSPSSFGGAPSSPASTQSEPVYTKTEGQDDIDQIIAPTRHLHVRTLPSYSIDPSDEFRTVTAAWR